MDTVTPATRSRMMGAVPQKHSVPELRVRHVAHALGYRYRLHRRDLPGTPDIVFPKLGKVVFVHGCFWHRHGCRKTTTPSTNREYWLRKFAENRQRDKKAYRALHALGWGVLVLWECQTKRADFVAQKLRKFLGDAA